MTVYSTEPITYDSVEEQSQMVLAAILLRFSKRLKCIFSTPQSYCNYDNIQEDIYRYMNIITKNGLQSYVKGILSHKYSNKHYTVGFENDSSTQIHTTFLKLINGEDLEEDNIHDLNEMFITKFDYEQFDFSKLIKWFLNRTIKYKKIIVMALYMNMDLIF